MNVEEAVRSRYSAASQTVEDALCCPVDYDPRYLAIIPDEVIARDYGCGDPSRHLRPGETVLDLGSGGGKICFIAAQVVGPQGRVIGVDTNDEMLALARSSQAHVAERLGYDNVEFRRGQIQDMADVVDSDSVDVVVSNCVLNLVAQEDKAALFDEIFRVLKRGGRAVISDIVSDEVCPPELRQDPTLWSGCVSGAFQETYFLRAFEAAGFYGIRILVRDEQPWRTVEGIEFRSVTVEAFKGKQGPCFEHKQAVIYKGPFSSIADDDGHTYPRGERVAVCRKTFELLTQAPYAEHFIGIEPRVPIAAEDAELFPCTEGVLRRHPRATKGDGYALTTDAAECGPEGCC